MTDEKTELERLRGIERRLKEELRWFGSLHPLASLTADRAAKALERILNG